MITLRLYIHLWAECRIVAQRFWIPGNPGLSITFSKKKWLRSLVNLGVTETHLSQALQLVEKAITNALEDPAGRWILLQQHKESYAEWALSAQLGNKFTQVVIDRSYIDDNIRWIIDYKTCLANDIPEHLDNYRYQVQKYARIVKAYKPRHKIKLGLYFPLQKAWEEVYIF